MKKLPYMQLMKSGIWRIKKHVPRHLQQVIGSKVLTLSLRTGNRDIARRRVIIMMLKIYAILDSAEHYISCPHYAPYFPKLLRYSANEWFAQNA